MECSFLARKNCGREKYRDKLKEAEALALATEYFDEFANEQDGFLYYIIKWFNWFE